MWVAERDVVRVTSGQLATCSWYLVHHVYLLLSLSHRSQRTNWASG